jgi:Alanine dehydrogenase/PNT, C-terminal domain
MSPQEILNRMAVDGYPGVYLVGRNARRLTFLSQQHRALNLVWALHQLGRLHGGDEQRRAAKVAVVGGGLAGLTAAVAAKLLRARVTLLERKSDPIHLQRGCHFRYVHPNIYDWPAAHSTTAMTDLPCMNWGADTAHNIAESILSQWEALKGEIEVLHRYDVTRIGLPPVDGDGAGRPVITAEGPSGIHYRAYDIVILAVGFGLEVTMPPLPFLSYWENDNFSRPVISGSLPRRFLVSGCGDGGLIDVTRLSIKAYDHARFVLGMIRMSGLELLKERLEELDHEVFELAHYDRSTPGSFASRPDNRWRIERRVERLVRLGDIDEATAAARAVNDFHSEWLYHQYDQLTIPDELLELLPSRDDTRVTLNGPNRTPFDLNASILNRFVVFLLWRQGTIRYRPGKISTRPGTTGMPHTIEFRDPWGPTEGSQFDVSVGEFDEVVVRHGFIRAIERLFPSDLVRAMTETREPIDDPTRIPRYDDRFLRDSGHAPLLDGLKRKAFRDFALANVPRAAEALWPEAQFASGVVRGLGVISEPDGGTRYQIRVTEPSAQSGELVEAFCGVEVDRVGPAAPPQPERTSDSPTMTTRAAVRPLRCGLEICNLDSGHDRSGAVSRVLARGTIGAFVRLAGGRRGLLTTTAAIGGQRYAKVNHRLAQPGPSEIDVVADVAFVHWPVPSPIGSGLALANTRPNRADGVVAFLRDDIDCLQEFADDLDITTPTSIADAAPDDEVFKVGAGSGLTRGRVVAVNATTSVEAHSIFWYEGCFLVTATDPTMSFAAARDSGALVVRERDGAALGLVIAGNDAITCVCPLRPILDAFDCSLL